MSANRPSCRIQRHSSASFQFAGGCHTNSYNPTATGRDTEIRSEEHTSELQSLRHLVCRLLLEKKSKNFAAFFEFFSPLHFCVAHPLVSTDAMGATFFIMSEGPLDFPFSPCNAVLK